MLEDLLDDLFPGEWGRAVGEDFINYIRDGTLIVSPIAESINTATDEDKARIFN